MGPKLKYAGKLLLGVILIAWLVRQVDWSSLKTVLVSADGYLLAAGFAVTLLNVPLGALRWHVLVRPMAPGVRYLDILRLVLVGNIFNLLVPGGVAGDVVRGLKTRQLGLGGESAFGSVITDRLMGLLGLVLVGVAGLGFSWHLVLRSGLLPYVAGASGLILGIAVLLYSVRVGRLERLQASLRQYRNERAVLARAFGITLVSHLLMIASVYLLALALGAHVPFGHYLTLVPIIGIMTALPVTIGGLGVRDAGYVLLFPLVGMTKAEALGTSFLFFGVVLVTTLVGGIAYFLPDRPATTPAPETA